MIIAFAVFLPFALLASAFSCAMNAWLFIRQLRTRLATQAVLADTRQTAQATGPTVAHMIRRRLTLEQLVTRFLLHQARRALQDRRSANSIEFKHFGMSLLLLLTEARFPRTARAMAALHESADGCLFAQDLPFFVLSTILLIRTVDRKDDAAVLAPNRLCSAEYDTRSFILLFLNTMKTAGMLATKLVKLKSLPNIWSKRQKLQAQKATLAQRVARLESVEMAALASAAPADDDASAESSQDAAPAAGGAVSPQDAAPADGGSSQPPASHSDAAAGLVSDDESCHKAALPLVSLSVRLAECAWGKRLRARQS